MGRVGFDSNDRYCLNGLRLVPALSSNYLNYGSNGYQYRTEFEQYNKIISHGSAGAGPASSRFEPRVVKF